jgi:hypothetical protein
MAPENLVGFFPKSPENFRISGHGAINRLIFSGAGAAGFQRIFSEFAGWRRIFKRMFFPNNA